MATKKPMALVTDASSGIGFGVAPAALIDAGIRKDLQLDTAPAAARPLSARP